MTVTEQARIELLVVAALGMFLVGFVASKLVVDNVRPVAFVSVLFIGVILSLPILLWRTRWRRRAAEVTAIVSALLIIPSFIFFGPIFILPAALLANVAAQQLRDAGRAESSLHSN